jgi:carbon-monoxide dehydrogenase medium subunit
MRGQTLAESTISRAIEAVRAAADPQSDMRGSADYKRTLVGALVKRAIDIAVRRARGEHVEVGHIYA